MIKNILWDFDGVILDSMPIREYGFRQILSEYDNRLVDELIEYHVNNGGLSRFNKIKYFYNKILNKSIDEAGVEKYANDFSRIMKKELSNQKYLIEDSICFIKKNYQEINFHIVSGSEDKELNYLCKELCISNFFLSISGSPSHKNVLVSNVLKKYEYKTDNTILIGDSINDYEASKSNNIKFYGYNNLNLKEVSFKYLTSMAELDLGRG